MDAHEVLVAARNLLDATQWRCGFPDAGPGLCVEEALGVALGCPDWEHQNSHIRASGAYRALHEVVGVADPVYVWNDHCCQSKAEALAAFDRAIAVTAPAPPFESLGQEPATAREPISQKVVV